VTGGTEGLADKAAQPKLIYLAISPLERGLVSDKSPPLRVSLRLLANDFMLA